MTTGYSKISAVAEAAVKPSWDCVTVTDEIWRLATVELVAVADLWVDIKYQRDKIRPQHLRKICEEFEFNDYAPITVGVRSGRMYVIDGQHRAIAAVLIGLKQILARIIPTGCRQEEARAFVHQIRVANIKPIELYHAAIGEGDPEARAIAKWLKSEGLKMSITPSPRNIGFVKGFRERWRTDTAACKRAVLMCRYIDPDSNTENYIHSGIWYLYRMGIDVDEYKDKLLGNGGYTRIHYYSHKISGMEGTRGQSAKNVRFWARAVLCVINKGRKHKIELPRMRG